MPKTRDPKANVNAKVAKPADKQATPQAEQGRPSAAQVVAQGPEAATPQDLLQLQRQVGNRAVQRLVRRAQPEAPVGLEGGAVGGELEAKIASARGGGRPLDKQVGDKVGGALSADFSQVRVHTDTQSDDLNRSLSAKAFTHGQDIYFSHGTYAPGTHSGQKLLAHELTHVVQQGAAGRGAQRRIQRVAQSAPEITLSSRLTHAIDQSFAISPHAGADTNANRLAVQQHIFGGQANGGLHKQRTKQLEDVLEDLRGHRKKKSQRGQPGERRVVTAKHFMLMFAIASPDNLGAAQRYQQALKKNLDEDKFDQLSDGTRAALAGIGYRLEHEMDVNVNQFPVMTALNTRLRYLQDILANLEKNYQKGHPNAAFPNFRQIVPDRARTGLGQVDSAINRVSVRINHLQQLLGQNVDAFSAVDQDTELMDKFSVMDTQTRRVQETLVPSILDDKGKKSVFFKDTPEQKGGQVDTHYDSKRTHFALEEAYLTKVNVGSKEPLGSQSRGVTKDQLDALHRQALDQTREHMRQMLRSYVPTFMVQEYSSRMVDLILQQVHLEALEEMQAGGKGLPPTDYGFLALGSGGRLESTSFSDMDFALVIKDNKHKAYFQQLGQIMARKIHGLHERGAHGQSGSEPKGLRICEGGVFPANTGGTASYGSDVLIGTPKDLAKIQENTQFITVGRMDIPMDEDAEVFDALREPRLAFGSSGGQQLFTEYSQSLQQTLGQTKAGTTKTLAQDASEKTLAQAVGFALPDIGKASFDLKKEFYRLPQMIVKGLALRHGVNVTNTLNRIGAVRAFDNDFNALADELSEAVSVISRVRLLAHLHAGEQKDLVWWSTAQRPNDKPKDYALAPDEAQAMRRIAGNVLPRLMLYGRRLLSQPVDDVVVQKVEDLDRMGQPVTAPQSSSSPNQGRPLPTPPVRTPPTAKTPPPRPPRTDLLQRPPEPKPKVQTPQELDKEDLPRGGGQVRRMARAIEEQGT